jgi:photosystem II stability/assembly factor-like uncharacterized protein
MTRMRLHFAVSSLILTALLPEAAGAAEPRWARLGPFGGRVLEIEVARSAPRTLYAVTEAGVYRSDNAAARWVPAWNGLAPGASSLAVDPTNARVVYAGIEGFVPPGRPTVFKTVNGGATWQPAGLVREPALDIAVDPNQPATVLVGSRSDVFRSADGGATWSAVLSPGAPIALFEDVAFDPTASGVAYAASSNQGLFKTVDHGSTWTRKSDRLPGGKLSRLGVSPAGVLYAHSTGGILRSLDGGETWKRAGNIPDAFIRSFGFSATHDYVYAGTDRGIYRNNGRNTVWTPLRPGQFEDVASVAAGPDDDGTVYAGIGQFGGGFRGVLKSVDDGESWRPVNRGLGGETVSFVAVAPSDPRVIYAVLLGGVVRSTDGGATWRRIDPGPDSGTGGEIVRLVVDLRDPDVVYAAARFGRFLRSIDGGSSWTGKIIEDGSCVFPASLASDPRNPSRFVVTGSEETACQRGGETSCLTLETTDAGASWTCLEGARDKIFSFLVLDPRRPETLYAAGLDLTQRGVFKSTDQGVTWALSWDGFPGFPGPLALSSRGTLWAAGGLRLVKSRNGGQTWRLSDQRLPATAIVRQIAIARSNPSVLYVSTITQDAAGDPGSEALYVSTDNGVSWRRLAGPPLPRLSPLFSRYLTLDVDPRDPGRLYVGTQIGLYRLDGATE